MMLKEGQFCRIVPLSNNPSLYPINHPWLPPESSLVQLVRIYPYDNIWLCKIIKALDHVGSTVLLHKNRLIPATPEDPYVETDY